MADSKGMVNLFTVLVTLAYAGVIFRNYWSRRATYKLIWGIGMLLFALASAMEGAYYAWGWNDFAVRLWYLCGAVLVAAWLGQGSVHLLLAKRYAFTLLAVLLLGSVYATIKVFGTGLDPTAVTDGQLSGAPFEKGVRLLTPFFNSYGTVALAGGALYSAWTFWRNKIMFNRMVGSFLIAVGAMVIASGGTLSRFGLTEFLSLTELLAGLLMFVGFLFTIRREKHSRVASLDGAN